jgi:hypothetical protein
MGVSAGKDCDPASAVVVVERFIRSLEDGQSGLPKLTTASCSGVRRHQHKQQQQQQ